MPHCWVRECTSRTGTANPENKGLSYFKLPVNLAVQKKWVTACKAEYKKITENVRVCSKHFKTEDFKPGLRKLKPGVIPSIFKFARAGGNNDIAIEEMIKIIKQEFKTSPKEPAEQSGDEN